ncbi:macro domain-containing protein [Brevibacterium sp. 50QC2O2]
MLGCFVPGHVCIDNVIHAAAGPALREECAEHMRRQGHAEPTGSATLTAAYHLPASYLIHTIGPIVPSHRPTAADEAALASCYRSILDAAEAQRRHSYRRVLLHLHRGVRLPEGRRGRRRNPHHPRLAHQPPGEPHRTPRFCIHAHR